MSDPTRFDLDDRQRAMLAEMGVRVWWPQPSPVQAPARLDEGTSGGAEVVRPGRMEAAVVPAAPAASAATASSASPVLASVPEPLPTPVLPPANTSLALEHWPAGLAGMDWAALNASVVGCKSCALCVARKTPIPGSGPGRAQWMVVGDFPGEDEDQQGLPFIGQEGVLLDNMLKAVGVRRQTGAPEEGAAEGQFLACLTHAIKCRPPAGRNPEAAELAACAGYLSRQVALAQPRVILAMGRWAIQSLLGSSEPMGKLRGRVHHFEGVPVVVTYHPTSLLRTPQDKAKAWADLVLALQVTQA